MNDDKTDAQREQRRQSLSRLMDGDTADVEAGCRAFGSDVEVRADWHAYHLIGDVMRSADTGASTARDAEFLARLRERLADEPVPMAPAPLGAAARGAASPFRRQPWMSRAAIAAGFALVAGTLVVTRGSLSDGGGGQVALGGTNPGGATRQASFSSGGASSAAPFALVDGVMLRNSELDRYLEAHREYAPSDALNGGAVVRRAAVVVAGP
jgi:sigma-E factor negative regulatory protein RseA